EMISSDKRRHRRDYITSVIEYSLNPRIPDEAFDAVVADISESGLCLLTTYSLNKGQEIVIKNGTLAFDKKAIVRWSEKYTDFYYKAGVEFFH
ncbi:MAG: PilZ domain-containing protein, partial [Nitrospirota bacterium]